ncbi:MAG: GGDEF domain-containing protein [Pseudomonadota bacterium]|nr:GGDEF domain-containing protein [Pseudomonadota bacterium]
MSRNTLLSRMVYDWRLPFMLSILAVSLLLASQVGSLKPRSAIDPLDIIGEFSTLLIVLVGLVLIVTQRLDGIVTRLFFWGGCVLTFSLSLDLLEEFFSYPESLRLMSWLESLPQPFGLLILGFGAKEWVKEQHQVRRQLGVREKHLRAHEWVDPLTTLYTLPYFEKVLERELALHKHNRQHVVMASINLQAFARYNEEMGMQAGDLLLNKVSELTALYLRPGDCLCRYHSDQFLILLPATDFPEALSLIRLLADMLREQLALPHYMAIKTRVRRVNEVSPKHAMKQLLQQPEAIISDASRAHH